MMQALDAALVLTVHDEILTREPGLPGFAGPGFEGLKAALERVENHKNYANLHDVFGIAALYAVAIARGHVFNDGNKRTALVTALAYLELQGITLARDASLEETMVSVACGEIGEDALAQIFANLSGKVSCI